MASSAAVTGVLDLETEIQIVAAEIAETLDVETLLLSEEKTQPIKAAVGTKRTSNPAIARAPKKQRTNKVRGYGFARQEVNCLPDLIEHILSIGPIEWESVGKNHLDVYPACKRNVDSLRRKFASLHRQKVPTGNSHCPPEVQRAKRIIKLIKEKSEIGNAEDDDEFDIGNDLGLEKTTDVDDELQKDADEIEEAVGLGAIQTTRGANNNSAIFNRRRLVHPRRKKEEENEDLVTLYKLSIIEDQKERKKRRKLEAERADRERERAVREEYNEHDDVKHDE
ncbi:hypothetical protein FGB62_361g02 [Gracilaria domingensis]|nr:hypothetical protein FGB62_361g02 [Gracilaria domingensis]